MIVQVEKGMLWAEILDLNTAGKILYRYTNNPSQGQSYSSTVVANGMLFFNMAYGYTDALKLK